MTQSFPEYSELKQVFETNFENKIGQNIPANDKAFFRVVSDNQAITAVILRVELINAMKANLAITAPLEDLKLIGIEYDVPYKEAISTVLTADLPATTGTVIPANKNFIADDTGIIYYTSTSVIAAAGVATLTLTSKTPGAIGNLIATQELNIQGQIAGAELVAEVTAVTTTGAEAEETEEYRQRVLDEIRAPGGGANSADFRNWAQQEEGIVRAYPYSGNPTYLSTGIGTTSSGDRTVFCECSTSIESDGITPSGLLATTKATIITNATTGIHRQPLGITNTYLYVVAITRTAFYVLISGAIFLIGTDAQVKAAVDTALDSYFLNLEPFVTGLDVEDERNDFITALSLSETVQQVLKANGASALSIQFGTMPGSYVPSYQLTAGEKAKNGGVTYV